MCQTELTEEQKKEECFCEGCNFSSLKHFEECPNCESKAYHITKSPLNRVYEE